MFALTVLAQAGSAATWFVAIAAVAGAFGVVLLWQILRSARALGGALEEQGRLLSEMRDRLKRLDSDRADLDLRRTEHVLIDIRDGLKGLEDAVIEAVSRPVAVERASEPAASPQVPALDPADAVLERVHNRLAALGYERVQIIGERDLFEMAAVGRTEVPIEARRAGVVFKGRCVVEKGRVIDVRMDPPYALFP